MILVTGVSGSLGGLVLAGLRAQTDLEVVAGSSSGDGTTARRLDFDDPATLADGFRGADVLVFVSAGYAEDDVVLARHGAVVDAATAAGVRHVIYSSLAGSASSATIAVPHRWTESRLAAAPFEVTVLRNGLYTEVPVGLALAAAESTAETGVFAAAFGDGRISVVAREDLADIAVRVAAEADRDLRNGSRNRHAGRTYELEGVDSLSGADIAEALGEALGRPVRYQDISLTEVRNGLSGSGLQPYQIGHTLSLFSNLKAGFLHGTGGDLRTLLPAAPRRVHDQIAAAVTLPATIGN
ncbi:MAG: dehydrogenase (quinone) [Nocardia sp.]|uniref:NmrA family NAD(P)-binding protein n=1 Tax=Nocardia sp. TaxID=1821 RepID=UPI0026142A26|nr:NmrA family NAD(P)-binding protein [Nocardia sp.]MCU1642305.1 dehydrogenase (quinone) [Nocardia sp.]